MDGNSLLASDVETGTTTTTTTTTIITVIIIIMIIIGKSDPVCFLFCAPIGTPEPDWEACGKALLEGDASHGVLMTKGIHRHNYYHYY